MRTYRRVRIPGATYFFTVNLARRHGTSLLIDHIAALRQAFRLTRQFHPFEVDAIVVLPDHLHCLWRLPSDDDNYPQRWREIKARFSMALPDTGTISASRQRKGEREIWQRRYWEHVVRDEHDRRAHLDYIHYNAVKHGYVQKAIDWPFSSFHRYVAQGNYPADWAATIDHLDLEFD